MIKLKHLPFVLKQIVRRPGRSLLTILGISCAMFLFFSVQAMHEGFINATQEAAKDTRLVVYRQDRYCPFSSILPEDYSRQIAKIPGVAGVTPMKIVVNNCRASLDVITFRGVPPDDFERSLMKDIKIVSGSLQAWKSRTDGALIGERFASRRRLNVGDRINLGGITVTVSGIISSPHPQDQNVAYTHLEFIQRTAGNTDGIVTQFLVKVTSPELMTEVANAIDKAFSISQDPTSTWSEKAFTARAASDLVEIVRFARYLGFGALIAVFAMVANAIALAARQRVREHAVLMTLGFTKRLIGGLIVAESTLISIFGGIIGLGAGLAVVKWSRFTFSAAGLSVNIEAGMATVFWGLFLCLLLGIFAGILPALSAGRREISSCLRSV